MPPGVPREASEQLADLFRPQSLASFGDEVSRVAWRVKPATYILTENDGVVSPAFQESLAVRSGARSSASLTVTRRSRRTPPASRTSSAPSRSRPSRTEHPTRTTEPQTDDRIHHWRRAGR